MNKTPKPWLTKLWVKQFDKEKKKKNQNFPRNKMSSLCNKPILLVSIFVELFAVLYVNVSLSFEKNTACLYPGFSAFGKSKRNRSWWVSIPLGNWFSGVVTMWRWKTISKALNRCCNYLTHTSTPEYEAPTVIEHLSWGKATIFLSIWGLFPARQCTAP